jgi:hypothetical protein
MDNELLKNLFAFVDRFRQNEVILETLAMSECSVFVGIPESENLLSEDQVKFVKTSLIDVVRKEQNDTWEKMASLLDTGSPYQ